MSSSSDLEAIAEQLVNEGPVRTESAAPRRIRAVFDSQTIVDTTDAVYVWEHDKYPWLYVPASSLSNAVKKEHQRSVSGPKGKADLYGVTVSSGKVAPVMIFEGGPLDGLTRIEFGAIDKWFEEDIALNVHPKDKYKRVVLPSLRPVKVSLDGVMLAESPFAMHLFETSLPVRYYLPKTSANMDYLKPSNTRSRCPYKGEAEYYDVVIKGKTYKDYVWYYDNPLPESVGVRGLLCFYNEKVDIELDGKPLTRPKTHF